MPRSRQTAPRFLRPDLAVVATALLGVAALHVASALVAPPLVPIAAAPARNGARVAIEGRALAVTHSAHGRAIVLAQDGWRLSVLALDAPGPARGDVVRAIGVMDGDHLSADTLAVTLPAATRALDPSDLAAQPRDFEGARVLVRGEVKAGPALAGGGARVALVGAAPPKEPGAWLATGTFYYSANDAAYKLTVDSWTPSS